LSLSGGAGCAILGHAQGITIEVTATDRGRLQSIVGDRNSPQKHVWRARIVLLSADGLGTMAIMRAVGKGKTVVWRWQERFMQEGVAELIRDKTRPSRIAALPAETVDRVIELINQAPPHQATHWTAPAMAKTVGISRSSVRRISRGLNRARGYYDLLSRSVAGQQHVGGDEVGGVFLLQPRGVQGTSSA
jgi:transposase